MLQQFPQYWQAPEEFEAIWKQCLEAIQQCWKGCAILRKRCTCMSHTAHVRMKGYTPTRLMGTHMKELYETNVHVDIPQ
jgi:hypothetical protein